jgi:hypothetical protein
VASILENHFNLLYSLLRELPGELSLANLVEEKILQPNGPDADFAAK